MFKKLFRKPEPAPDKCHRDPATGKWVLSAKAKAARAAQPKPTLTEQQIALAQLQGHQQERKAKRASDIRKHQAHSASVMASMESRQPADTTAQDWQAYLQQEVERGWRLLEEMDKRHGTVRQRGNAVPAQVERQKYAPSTVRTAAAPVTAAGKALVRDLRKTLGAEADMESFYAATRAARKLCGKGKWADDLRSAADSVLLPAAQALGIKVVTRRAT